MTRLAQINAPLGNPPPRPDYSFRRFETAAEIESPNAEEPLRNVAACDGDGSNSIDDLYVHTQIKDALETLNAQARLLCKQSHLELVDWLRTALETAAPTLTRACTDAAFAQVLKCGKSHPIEIKVHSSIYETFARNLPESGGVSIVEDDDLNGYAVHASWRDGEMFADPAGAMTEIISLLKEKLNFLNTTE